MNLVTKPRLTDALGRVFRMQIDLLSISPTFYEQLLRQNPFAKKLQTQIVSTLNLHRKLSYEKAACKILVKLTPEVVPELSLHVPQHHEGLLLRRVGVDHPV